MVVGGGAHILGDVITIARENLLEKFGKIGGVFELFESIFVGTLQDCYFDVCLFACMCEFW